MEIKVIENCPCCGCGDFDRLFSIGMALPTGNTPNEMVRCRSCRVVWALHRAYGDQVEQLYESSYLWDKDSEDKGLLAQAATAYRNHLLDIEISRDIKRGRFSAGAKVLDYGTGYGDRLERMRKKKLDAIGFEPFFKAPLKLSGQIFHTQKDLLSHLEPSSLEMIQFNHVIGHLHDLIPDLSLVLPKLKPGGMVVVRTPNPESLQAQFFGRRWQGVDPARILTLFPASALISLFERFGFRCLSIDHYCNLLHPPTLVQSLFPALDPLAPDLGPTASLRKLAWGMATLAAGPVAKAESAMGRGSVYCAYFEKMGR